MCKCVRGVTIHWYGSIYNVWRYDASMPRIKYRYLSYKMAPLFWHCPHFHIMSVYALPPTQRVHSRSISRIRTRYKDCPKAQGEHIRRSGLLVEQNAYAHTSEARAHRQPRQLWANTKLSSPPLFWAWMNKFRQNYIKMHVLANILVNSR